MTDKVDLMQILEHKRIVVYGAGFVAEKFYEALVIQGLHRNVECFVVSRKEPEQKFLKGKNVISIDEFENSENILICLAVHDVTKNEIEEILDKRGITNRIWIRPYLFDLVLGKPTRSGVIMPVDPIVRQCVDYRIAVRYLAVENYFGKNDCGYEIYKKALEAYCGRETAEKRLENFRRLIQSWERSGYLADSTILIDEKGEIIDGAHRITLARYFRTDRVLCDVYQTSEKYLEWIGSGALLPQDKAAQFGFTDKEIEMMEEAYQRIRE